MSIKLLRLPATTIIESIIAMVILMISFGVSVALFTQLQTTEGNQLKTKALFEARTIVDRAKAGLLVSDTTVNTPLYSIVAQIRHAPHPDSLWNISILAQSDKGFVLVKFQEQYFIPASER